MWEFLLIVRQWAGPCVLSEACLTEERLAPRSAFRVKFLACVANLLQRTFTMAGPTVRIPLRARSLALEEPGVGGSARLPTPVQGSGGLPA